MTALAVCRRTDCRRWPKGLLRLEDRLEYDPGSVRDQYPIKAYICRGEANLGQLNHQELDSEDNLKRKWSKRQAA